MLGELAVLDADNVGRDPGGVPSTAREAAMRDDVVALGYGELLVLV